MLHWIILAANFCFGILKHFQRGLRVISFIGITQWFGEKILRLVFPRTCIHPVNASPAVLPGEREGKLLWLSPFYERVRLFPLRCFPDLHRVADLAPSLAFRHLSSRDEGCKPMRRVCDWLRYGFLHSRDHYWPFLCTCKCRWWINILVFVHQNWESVRSAK